MNTIPDGYTTVTPRVRDPFGNLWWIQQRVAELTEEEMAERAELPEFVENMRYVQSAELRP